MPSGATAAGRWSPRQWARSADVRSVGVLLALPALLLVVPAALGHPAITGDNLIQNFPLRVLSGRQLRAGHLPVWNPYVWGGSPLLGGLNAGSFYPLTFLFAVLAPVAAWVGNLLAVYWAGGLGLYALARQYGLRPRAALIGGLTYALSGTLVGQIVHLGVVEGMSLAPLLVLAELRLSWAVLGTGPVRDGGRGEAGTVPARRSSPWPWMALLALVVGLEALTGEPRAMAETEVVAVAVGLWLLLRPYAGHVGLARRARFLVFTVVAGGWGVVLAAAELAPGWAFIQASQRAVEGYRFFGSGSLPVPWTLLLLVPDLMGGTGHFGQPAYFDRYNLAEVTGYVGLLPLAAALVLASRSFGRRRSPKSSDWGLWLALATLGLLLSWGSSTPLGHLWAHIPLFGHTRLQSRNLGIVDLGLAMLLAFWVDRLADRQAADGTAGWRRLLAAAPAVAAAGTCMAALIAPAAVEGWLGVTPYGASLVRYLWPSFLAECLVAAGVVGLVFGWRRLGVHRRRVLLTAVVVCDLAFFLLAASTVSEPSSVTYEPGHAAAAAVLGTKGRFAIVDTQVTEATALTAIGPPDMNALTGIPSVQGYGSIVSGAYAAATGTHTRNSLSACDLSTGVFEQLRLATILAAPGDLAPSLTSEHRAPPPPPQCRGASRPGTGDRRVLYLGWTTTLRRATLVATTRQPARAPVRVGIVGGRGAIRWPREVVRRTTRGWSVRFGHPTQAAGIVVEGPAQDVSDTSTVRGPTGGWAFDGIVQDALDASGWRFTGTWDGTFGRFVHATVKPPVWLVGAAAGSSVRHVAVSDWGTAAAQVVATSAATVVWSEAYLPGWHAELAPGGGAAGRGSRARSLVVTEHGLVQSVRVPKGRWRITFVYRPPHLTLGIAGSLVGVAGFAVLGAFGLATVIRRRRRHAAWSGPAPLQEAGEPAASGPMVEANGVTVADGVEAKGVAVPDGAAAGTGRRALRLGGGARRLRSSGGPRRPARSR